MKIYFFLFFVALNINLFAQTDSILLTKNFKFNDGVYLTFESFKNNLPDYNWKEVKSNIFTNPQTYITQIEYIKVKATQKEIDVHNIWGVSIDGIPYVLLPENALKNVLASFAGLRVRGKICYFNFENNVDEKINMPVYNPLTGRPFRSMMVSREKKVVHEKLLEFETGEIHPFTLEKFKSLISNDAGLLASVNELKPEEVRKKLFKCLLIYDDRHAVYMKNATTDK